MQILPCSILTVEMGAGSKVRWDGVLSLSDGPIEEKPRMGGVISVMLVGGGKVKQACKLLHQKFLSVCSLIWKCFCIQYIS